MLIPKLDNQPRVGYMEPETRKRIKLIAEIQIETLRGLLRALKIIAKDQRTYSLEDLIADTEMSIEELKQELLVIQGKHERS